MPVIKPLDADIVVAEARRSGVVVTAENHTVLSGLGSAGAEALAEAGSATPLRRVRIGDVFGESGSREYLFTRYGLKAFSGLTESAGSSLCWICNSTFVSNQYGGRNGQAIFSGLA